MDPLRPISLATGGSEYWCTQQSLAREDTTITHSFGPLCALGAHTACTFTAVVLHPARCPTPLYMLSFPFPRFFFIFPPGDPFPGLLSSARLSWTVRQHTLDTAVLAIHIFVFLFLWPRMFWLSTPAWPPGGDVQVRCAFSMHKSSVWDER